MTVGRVVYRLGMLIVISQILVCCTIKQNTALLQEEEIRLSPPIFYYESSLFEDSILVKFAPNYPGSTIHYSTEGTHPDEKSSVFSQNQHFTQTTHLKAITFHPHLQASEMVEINFLKVKMLAQIKEITILQEPSENYPGQGAKSLIDLQKGTLNFREKTWMGFDQKVVEIQLEFETPKKLSQLTLSTMQDHGSWIFLPEKIEVIWSNDSVLSQWEIPQAAAAKRLAYLSISLDEIETQNLHIRITNADAIPDWHAGAGNAPWLFIDEIIIE